MTEGARRQCRLALTRKNTETHDELQLALFSSNHWSEETGQVRTADAIGWLRRAEAVRADPEVLALLGDLHAASGHRAAARAYYDRVESVAREDELSERMYRVFLANFYADREWRLDDARALALAELEGRHDVETYETAAWALYKTGDYPQATRLMEHALRMGTRDAQMLHRAGQIALAVGDTERGHRLLSESRSVNPYFHPSYGTVR